MSENTLQIFSNPTFGTVRTLQESGNVLFCGSDVAKALGYSNAPDALNRHCRYIAKRDTATVQGNISSMAFIPEGDIYRLVTQSKLPDAQRFADWVFDEVLPTIRKTGGYVSNDEMFISTYFSHMDENAKAAFRQTLQGLRAANAKIEQDAPKVLFADAVTASKTSILVGELAKLLQQNGVKDMGQNRLFAWMRDNGYLIRRNGTDFNAPTQRSMEAGLFEVKETTITHGDGSTTINRTTKVTGKGQTHFVNLFLNNKKELNK